MSPSDRRDILQKLPQLRAQMLINRLNLGKMMRNPLIAELTQGEKLDEPLTAFYNELIRLSDAELESVGVQELLDAQSKILFEKLDQLAQFFRNVDNIHIIKGSQDRMFADMIRPVCDALAGVSELFQTLDARF